MLCSYNVSLMVEGGCMPCSYFVGRAIKMGVFALKKVGVVDFVVWIFFCKFVGCVWWIL